MLGNAFKRFLYAINNGTAPAWLQKAVWKFWYQSMAKRWRDDGWSFMNYGWLPPQDDGSFVLDESDEPDRYFIGLYYHLAALANPEGKQVLEVGSGRGGGASYLARYHQPAKVLGVDYSSKAVSLSRRIHNKVPQLEFLEGDAEKLPLDDECFDIVFNVESSHCYPSMDAFVNEVVRVLRPGGYFAWADIRGPGMMVATEKAFSHPKLELVHNENITDNVLHALNAAQERKENLINELKFGKGLISQFAGMPGSSIYQSLKSGTTQYLCRVYKKI